MRRLLIAAGVVGALLVLTVPAAFAASPHFKKGGVPVCTFAGTTSIPVTCTGTLAGLGNEDLDLHLSVNGAGREARDEFPSAEFASGRHPRRRPH
jgi:hypothetical protein